MADYHEDSVAAIARQLFQLDEATTEAGVGMAKAVGGAIVDDLIGHTKELRKRTGQDGFLVLTPTSPSQRPVWETAESMMRKMDQARRFGDDEILEVFRKTLVQFEQTNPDEHCFIAVAGKRGNGDFYFAAYKIPVDDPQANLVQTLRRAMGES